MCVVGNVQFICRWLLFKCERSQLELLGPLAGLEPANAIDGGTAVSKAYRYDMQVTGLLHVLSISGMHMAIVCGLLYAAMRRILLFVPVIGQGVRVQKYAAALGSGTVDPEETLPKFIEELKKAGIEKVISTKQEQLDKWLEENK